MGYIVFRGVGCDNTLSDKDLESKRGAKMGSFGCTCFWAGLSRRGGVLDGQGANDRWARGAAYHQNTRSVPEGRPGDAYLKERGSQEAIPLFSPGTGAFLTLTLHETLVKLQPSGPD